jgi:LTXXQ motif family protein
MVAGLAAGMVVVSAARMLLVAVGTSVAAGMARQEAVARAAMATGTEPIDRRRVAMFVSIFARGVALVALLVPAIGFAQSAAQLPATATAGPTAASPAAAQTAAPASSATAQAAVDQRIRTLQSQLGITEAQMPLWTAFAQAMRDNAASTDALFSQRASTVASMSAVENMRSYAQIARAYAENTERLATAFESLYASLTDTQKQAADTLFRQQASAASHPRSRR